MSKAFYDDKELLFVLAVHLKQPAADIKGWPQISDTTTGDPPAKFYEPIYLEKDGSASFNCTEAKSLVLPKICTFLSDNDCSKSVELANALDRVKAGCSRVF